MPLVGLADEQLAELSRRRMLSLDVTEMRAIQAHFTSCGRDPSDAELETLAQAWSEHCVHKTFKAQIHLSHTRADGRVEVSHHDGLLNALRQATAELDADWLRSVFVDNAGIVAFDGELDLAVKVETHNHPSALEPFGGANTGVVGVVRDILGVSAVQIGDPIVEKGCIEVVERARDEGLYNAITDCGAGGLSSALGEMGAELGAEVDLATVPLKYPGLQPWEIWLSEAQERMVLAVPAARVAPLLELCRTWHVELSDIGSFTSSGRLVVRHGDCDVIDLSMEFLHDGLPRRTLTATHRDRVAPAGPVGPPRAIDSEKLLLDMLAHPNVASRESIIRSYDHEVRGATVVRPFAGPGADGPTDAAVLLPGGFSYGADLGAGGRLALELQAWFGAELGEFARSGKPILGICNGFQALVKSGLLGHRNFTPTANAGGRFECRWVTVRIEGDCKAGWLEPLRGSLIRCPVAHGEGRLAVTDPIAAADLERARRDRPG